MPGEQNRLAKMQKKLVSANWLEEADEVNKIDEYYGEAIYDIVEFVETKNYSFANMEADVHELRRKIRWLSIYPQALRGSIQLSSKKPAPKHLAKYATKEITTSPFNKIARRRCDETFFDIGAKLFFCFKLADCRAGKIKRQRITCYCYKRGNSTNSRRYR